MKYASKETKSAVKLHPECNVMLIESKNDLLRGSKTSGRYFANILCNKSARRSKKAQTKNTGKHKINRVTVSRNFSLWAKSRTRRVLLMHPQAILSVRITGRLYITSTSQTRAALPSRKHRTQWCTKLGTIIFNTSFDFLRQKLQCCMHHGGYLDAISGWKIIQIFVWKLWDYWMCTFPKFWCSSNAAISSVAHLILSGLGENSSWTALIWLGWITCFPRKNQVQQKTQTNKSLTT